MGQSSSSTEYQATRSNGEPFSNDGLIKQQQQQSSEQDSRRIEEGGTSSYQNNHATTWSMTDFGRKGDYSRDGSVHVTDEVFNAASHLVGTVLSVLGTVLLIVQASAQGAPWKIVSFSLYGTSLFALFLCSTLHHGLEGPCEGLLRKLDYMAIYPLIAGTFTPLCLVFYHDSAIGWAFCSTVWALSLFGLILTAQYFHKIPKWFSMTMYISLGWIGACMTYWLVPVLGWDGFALFTFGGVLYTVGGFIYSTERPNPFPGHFGFHEIWHVAVLLAAFSHWMLMYLYVLPWKPAHN